MRCAKHVTLKCKGRANFNMYENPRKFVVTKNHNHPEDNSERVIFEFMDNLKKACKSGFNVPLKNVYHGVASAYVSQIIIFLSYL